MVRSCRRRSGRAPAGCTRGEVTSWRRQRPRPHPSDGGRKRPSRKRKLTRLSRGDRITVFVMVRSPPCWSSGWSGCRRSPRWSSASSGWEGVGGFDTIEWVGLDNYKNIFTNYPPFQPAIEHNLIWLLRAVPDPDPARHVPGGAAGQGDAGQPLLPDGAVPAGRAVAGPRRLHVAAHLLPGPGPDQRRSPAARPTGTATRTSTCGRCWWRPAGGRPATSCCCTWPA